MCEIQYIFLIVGIICGPLLLVWTFIRGDLEMTMNFPSLLSPGFLVNFGYWINFSVLYLYNLVWNCGCACVYLYDIFVWHSCGIVEFIF